MLDFAISELKHAKQKEIFLWVFEENIEARRFYEKNNFSFDGTKREVKYGKPLVQLRYVLNPAK
jgi:ribosomal protein S18 acetylase RimI-like enzyme